MSGPIEGSVLQLIPCLVIPGGVIIGHTYWVLHVLEIM